MKFPSFGEFQDSPKNNNIPDLVKYLSVELAAALKALSTGLPHLTFLENFDSFEAQVTIEPSSELAIRNLLRGGVVPTRRLIVRGDTYSSAIVDGPTTWDKDYVYLQNTDGVNSATATFIFFK